MIKLADPAIFDNLLDPVLITDESFLFVYSNSPLAALLGIPEPRLKNKDMSERLPLKEWILNPSINQEIRLSSGNSDVLLRVCYEMIDYLGRPSHFFYLRDISLEGGLQEKYKAELQEKKILYHSSITDEKTKLFNGRYLKSSLDRKFDRYHRFPNESFGLVIVDIDHFKKINDNYGHQIGDDVLVHIARIIKSVCRSTDIVARFGGEEFCIIVAKVELDGMRSFMEKLRKTIEFRSLSLEDQTPIKVTVSLGGALCPSHALDQKQLFAKADEALYQSKKNGRNRCTIWSQEDQ